MFRDYQISLENTAISKQQPLRGGGGGVGIKKTSENGGDPYTEGHNILWGDLITP